MGCCKQVVTPLAFFVGMLGISLQLLNNRNKEDTNMLRREQVTNIFRNFAS